MKRWLMLVLVLAFLLFLTACGNESTEDPPTESDGAPAENTEDIEGEEESPPEGEEADEAETEEGSSEEILMLTVEMMDSDGNAIGTAELSEEDAGVKVALEVEGLEEGMHGIHFHETGMCEGPDFETAGGHFNPADAMHGMDNPDGPHAGDLPNIEASSDGTASQEFTAENVTLAIGEENSLLKEGGTALVIHAAEDDQTTDPSGDSGDRIACGVVTGES
ncbi:superoxide dismutase family protein [Microbacterium sp. APC 3898]|uniref:Superoxide dismutase [Cu-Zn] n=1 Tax=Planococcus notacanthi TaxID=3035188 RepID=A0ABT7ZKH3_9BACL|nr:MULTISPECIES: superoxide dismutase family protein [Terrabacteria group]MBF6634485.1 superoxide dismutase family protein [Planococcus sp. (in: firmicutes)]MDN3427645.1 superoxide dismutase family protein [Planococcus sp. APC 4016]MDN3437000.1 superoxide dismutase family protein [Planococcus sp. APC 3900]MDN3499197.1 superoxide dismutase family protein [Microbacterium sp. APC 3898]